MSATSDNNGRPGSRHRRSGPNESRRGQARRGASLSMLWVVTFSMTAGGASACCPPGMSAGPSDGRGAPPRAGDAPPATSAVEVAEVLQGKVSYYHDSLAGNRTANGEVYDPNKLTAASRTLPFGTRVRVTRLDTGKSIIVRINDRGPFGRRSRILDLSRRAAERLDMIRKGVIDARAEILR